MSRNTQIFKLVALALGAAALPMLSGCKKPPPQGACCSPDGNCVASIQTGCTGRWQLGSCTPNPCPQPPPPPPVEVSFDTLLQQEKADARVQFADGMKVI